MEDVIQNNLLLSHSKLHVCISFVNPIKILTVISHTFKDRVSCKIFASAHLNKLHYNENVLEWKELLLFRFYLTFQRLLGYFCVALWKRGLRNTSTSDWLPARLPALCTLASTISTLAADKLCQQTGKINTPFMYVVTIKLVSKIKIWGFVEMQVLPYN